jgi:pimeloyl-ACP methyl ester carboxylesterase
MKMDFLYVRTKDDLRLQGVHYEPGVKETAVLLVHGMSGNIIENYFAHVLGQTLTKNDVGLVYSHNRGYGHINDIATSKLKEKGGYNTVRLGANFEVFEDCLMDIDAWINEVKRLGYKKIVLMGHSLGCNKIIYYFSQRKPKDVVGMILASPPDLIGQLKPEYQPDAKELLEEAQMNVKNGHPRKLLSKNLWDWFYLSGQTFLSLFTEGSNSDNLPIMRNPDKWNQLASLTVPILAFMGEYDDIAIRHLSEDLNLIKKRAVGTSSFTQKLILKASHTYDGQEEVVASEVLNWIATKV